MSLALLSVTSRSKERRGTEHLGARPRSLNIVVSVLIVMGSALLIYPSAGTWFTDRAHAADVSGYVETVKSSTSDVLDKLLDDARRYNAALPTGPLRDPFTLTESGTAESINASRGEYDKQLALGSDGVIARLRVPSISLDLPIYHGTAPVTLDEGVGHLYGSSLPVGGDGTHAVLTGHSGLPNATLFTNLDRLKKGDRFFVDVDGEELEYEVDRIAVVSPDDPSALRQVPGHDYVTLLTCTPTGVNTFRLLVRGARVPTPPEKAGAKAVGSGVSDPGFPWWIVPSIAAVLVAAGAVAFPAARARRAGGLSA